MSYVKYALGVVGALSLLAVQQAKATTLADLVSSGSSITVGGQTYSGFVAGGTLPASDVTVNFTDTGVQFTGNWNTLTPGANSSVISYTVTPVVGTFTGAQLFFGGQVIVNNGTASVGETLSDSAGHDYSLQVYYAGQGAANNNLRDAITLNPEATSLRVVKSIDVAASGADSFASLNFVENTYTTNPKGTGEQPGVPEPMSLALLPLALAGLGLRKKFAR